MEAAKTSFRGQLGRSAAVRAARGVLPSAEKKCAVEPREDAGKPEFTLPNARRRPERAESVWFQICDVPKRAKPWQR